MQQNMVDLASLTIELLALMFFVFLWSIAAVYWAYIGAEKFRNLMIGVLILAVGGFFIILLNHLEQLGRLIWMMIYITVGGLTALYPYKAAKLSEYFQGIGSERPEDKIEPAHWNVVLHRVIGFVVFLVGIGLLLNSIF